MCGIAGFCDFNKHSSKEVLVGMTDQLNYRGPDSYGYFMDEQSGYSIGLGHRRLSILDLSSLGAQPMSLDHLHIILNGEIYNFEEVRKELEPFGYTFKSHSDTEVVLAAFHKWGINCIQKFIGMFAFAVYDTQQQEIHIVRDRAGVKPVYYSFMNNVLMFASELKAIVKHPSFKKVISQEAMKHYFSVGYIPQPLSIFQDAFKLKAGHYLKLDLRSKRIDEIKYWDVIDHYNKPKLALSENEILEELEKLLLSACKYRMVADVPVGVFLSGGYDSSAVTALIQSQQQNRLNTYTIGFEEAQYNEAPFAKLIAKHIGTNHHEYYCTVNDAKGILPLLSRMFDEPFGDSSAIPTYLVSKNARKEVTVALSADGGDEIFGGYTSYITAQKYINRFAKLNPALKSIVKGGLKMTPNAIYNLMVRDNYNTETRLQKIKEMLVSEISIGEAFQSVTSINAKMEIQQFLRNKNPTQFSPFNAASGLNNGNSLLDRLTATDYKVYMVDDILTKVDRTTMAVSLEGREPLLDHRVIEFMAQVPSKFKIHQGEKKYLLKQITHKYIPKELLDRPKKGFAFPVFEWLREDLNDYLLEYLNEYRINQQGLFDWNELYPMLRSYQNGRQINAQKIWLLLMFQMWYYEWME